MYYSIMIMFVSTKEKFSDDITSTILSLNKVKVNQIGVLLDFLSDSVSVMDDVQIKLMITELKNIKRIIFLDRNYIDYDIDIANFNPLILDNLTNLEYLFIGVNKKVTNLDFLLRIPSLKKLSVQCGSIVDFSTLGQLTNLIELGLHNCINLNESQLIELTQQIAKLSSLTGLEITNFGLKDISALYTLKNLKVLSLIGNNLFNIDVVRNFVNLTLLNISHNNVENIEVLKSLIFLEELYMYKNKISNIDSLANLTSLKKLVIEKNLISNIDPLKKLVNLMELRAAYNQISDISVCENFENLNYLSIEGNPVIDISILIKLKKLKHIVIPKKNNIDTSKFSSDVRIIKTN